MKKLALKKSKKRDDKVVVEQSVSSLSVKEVAEPSVVVSCTADKVIGQPQAGQASQVDENQKDENDTESRKRNWVWKYFKEYKDIKVIKVKGQPDIVKEFRRAKCIFCPKGKLGDYAADSYKNGTKGMIRHINEGCKYYPGRRAVDKNQKLIVGDKSQGNRMKVMKFNQDEVMRACVEMVVMDELPFSFVEKKGFRRFCFVMQPDFKVPCRGTLVNQFLKLYDRTKKKLKADMSHHRVCLTTDTWTSVQNFNYMVLTAHFIDKDWVMHKRIINFCTIASHSGNSIGKLIEECLIQWGINKVLTITVDNAAANKCAIEYVVSKLNKMVNSQSILEGKLTHVRCTSHICNLIAGSGLKKLNRGILAIRNAVKFVRSSPSRLEVFKAAVKKEHIPCRGLVVLDVPTRWNSTFLMLEATLKFKAAFTRMKEDEETGFAAYFKESEEEYDDDGNVIVPPANKLKKGKVGPPSNEDWEKAEIFVQFLRVFYETTLRVSASNRPTVHTTFHDVLSIETEIHKLIVEPDLRTVSESEKVLSEMAENMLSKYLKYYGSFKDLNPLLFVGLMLDPRFKLLHIQYLLKKEGYGDEFVDEKSKELKEIFMQLYEAYAPKETKGVGKKKVVAASSSRSKSSSLNTSRGVASIMIDWRKVVSELDEQPPQHEVDKYLLDPLEDVVEGESEYPILLWWKLNMHKYPVIALIAKDVLAVQVSTIASEVAFSTGGRVVDSFRSSLTPKSVEALICLQSWLRGSDISCTIEDAPCITEFEFYEKCEKDHSTSSSSSSVNFCPSENVEQIQDESEDDFGNECDEYGFEDGDEDEAADGVQGHEDEDGSGSD